MNSAEIREIIESRKTILEALSQMQRRLDAYEYSPEDLEFLSNPHQIAIDEQLTSEEIDEIWDEIAASLQLTPQWCLEARIAYTLSMGGDCSRGSGGANRLHIFSQLLPRLSGAHREKFKAIAVAYAPRNEIDKYVEFAERSLRPVGGCR